MTQDEAKALVGKRAATLIQSGMRVGLGTGSTAAMFIQSLASHVKATGIKIKCTASSKASYELACKLGLKVFALEQLPELDIYVDGADEVGPQLALIKGGGAAHFREKVTAKAAKEFVVVVDESKIVPRLGAFPLPLEVIGFSLSQVMRELSDLDLGPKIRLGKNGRKVLTDQGNYIVDCHAYSHKQPRYLARILDHITGILEHGFFLRMASRVLVATSRGVVEFPPMSATDWSHVCQMLKSAKKKSKAKDWLEIGAINS